MWMWEVEIYQSHTQGLNTFENKQFGRMLGTKLTSELTASRMLSMHPTPRTLKVKEKNSLMNGDRQMVWKHVKNKADLFVITAMNRAKD